MRHINEELTRALKAARVASGLSQRDLSARTGVPQSHISAIENGAVDLRASSLIALARALELELALVPRRLVPVVRSLAGARADDDRGAVETVQPAYSLDEGESDG